MKVATEAPQRASYVHAPSLFLLSQACLILVDAFGVPYHVGSSLHRPDFRDVDVRIIMPDRDYDALFPGAERGVREMVNARWSVMCASISLYLSQASGLPVDFQFQQQTGANDRYPGPRHPLGIFPSIGLAEAPTTGAPFEDDRPAGCVCHYREDIDRGDVLTAPPDGCPVHTPWAFPGYSLASEGRDTR